MTTSSPLARASTMALCSFWRFIWGRIITKYSTTNISTSGSMLSRLDSVPPAAGAACAKALEINTEVPRCHRAGHRALSAGKRRNCMPPVSANRPGIARVRRWGTDRPTPARAPVHEPVFGKWFHSVAPILARAAVIRVPKRWPTLPGFAVRELSMALFPQRALNEGVRKREVFGWALYDFANSGYTTVVLTAVFNSYFVGVVAGGASWATLAWTMVIAASSLIVMVTMPAI